MVSRWVDLLRKQGPPRRPQKREDRRLPAQRCKFQVGKNVRSPHTTIYIVFQSTLTSSSTLRRRSDSLTVTLAV